MPSALRLVRPTSGHDLQLHVRCLSLHLVASAARHSKRAHERSCAPQQTADTQQHAFTIHQPPKQSMLAVVLDIHRSSSNGLTLPLLVREMLSCLWCYVRGTGSHGGIEWDPEGLTLTRLDHCNCLGFCDTTLYNLNLRLPLLLLLLSRPRVDRAEYDGGVVA